MFEQGSPDMPEKAPQGHVPQPRKKRPPGRLAGNGLDVDKPRPQTVRTAAMMSQRRIHQTSKAQPATASGEAPPGVNLQTIDNRVTYVLRCTADSLLLQRTSWRRADAQLLQTFHFTKVDAFDLWCEADILRFEEPHLWAQLLRTGHDLLGGAR